MKLFVTGGAGFIGSAFVRLALSLHKGSAIVNYDKLTCAGSLANLDSVVEKFLPLMISRALVDQPLPIYGDRLQQRNWIHVDDNCRAILAVLERGRLGHVYNIGGPDVKDDLAMAHSLLKIMGKPDNLISHVPDKPGRDRRYALNSSKIRRELNWKPGDSARPGPAPNSRVVPREPYRLD